MFTNTEAEYLLSLPKKLQEGGLLVDSFKMDQIFPFQHKLKLISPDDSDFEFLYEINQSKKNQFKLSLYVMEEEARVGLLRVDFNGQHENPQIATDKVPAFIAQYNGKWFDYNDHHIHFYVEGYRTSLDWAIPLSVDQFPIKKITSPQDIITAFTSFNSRINLITNFAVNPLLV